MIQYLCGMDPRMRQRKARLLDICQGYIYPWLVGLAGRNRKSGNFPLFLGDFYGSPKDKEVAEAAALLFPLEPGRDNYLMRMRNILGDNPRDMVESRAFVNYGGKLRMSAFHSESVIFNVLDWIWETCCRDKVPLEYVVLGELGYVRPYHMTPLSAVFPLKDMKIKLELLLNKMSPIDGFGTGMWHFLDIGRLPCPMTKDVLKVMKAYFPIENGMSESPSEIIKFFGFERQCDFLYSVWEYERLRKQQKKEITAQEKMIHRWYKSARIMVNLRPKLE